MQKVHYNKENKRDKFYQIFATTNNAVFTCSSAKYGLCFLVNMSFSVFEKH